MSLIIAILLDMAIVYYCSGYGIEGGETLGMSLAIIIAGGLAGLRE